MRPVRIHWFPALFSIFFIPGCTSSTELSREVHAPDIDFRRAEYAAMYPESPHVEAVRNGTVVAGMDTTAVAAAWGPPQVRDERAIESTEWVYFEIDPDSHDPVDYVLQFNAGLLTEWDTRVHEVLNGRDIVFDAWLARSEKEKRMREYQNLKQHPAFRYPQRPKPKSEPKKP